MWWISVQFSSVTVVSESLQPHGLQHTRPPCLAPTPGVYSTQVHWVSDAIQPSHPLSSPPAPAFIQSFPSSGSFPKSQLFASWPNYWSFSFSISPSNEYSGLISFRMDWLVLLAVQGTFKSLLQYHGSKASILMTLAQVP